MHCGFVTFVSQHGQGKKMQRSGGMKGGQVEGKGGPDAWRTRDPDGSTV